MVGIKSPLSGIQVLPDNYNVATGTLAAFTAQLVNQNYGGGLTRSFLLKRISQQHVSGVIANADGCIFGFARGDMTIAEIAAALNTHIADPNNFDNWDLLANLNGILWQTLFPMGTDDSVMNLDVKIGGKKGIPIIAGVGVNLFVYNPQAAAMTTGALHGGLFQLKGIWLDEIVASA